MPLRIGVVSGSQSAEWGGGGILTAVLTAALKSAHTRHEFLFIDEFLRPDASKLLQASAFEIPQPDTSEIPQLGASEMPQPDASEVAQAAPSQMPQPGASEPDEELPNPTVVRLLRSAIDRGVSVTLRLLPEDVRSCFAKETSRDPPPAAPQQTFPEPCEPTILELLEQAIIRERLDLVWYMIPNGFPLSIPFIATVWDLEHRKQPYFPEVSVAVWTWSERELNYSALLPRASVIITGTEVGKNEVVKYYGVNADNVTVIPFPTPPVDLRPTADDIRAMLEKYAITAKFLLYPAQFWPHKNHANLLISLAVLQRESGFCPSLVMTGSEKGNREHVRKLVNELHLSEQVFDLGFVSREELNCLYASAALLVFPSFFGPDNLPPLEAFALGCPVVAADIPGAREQLGRGALYFDPSDPEQIATRILEVCGDADCRRRLIEEGAVISRQRTPEAYISEICKVLDGFEAIRRCWGRTL
jgi:glycosyltransferase involved in cell wall biosynthesis